VSTTCRHTYGRVHGDFTPRPFNVPVKRNRNMTLVSPETQLERNCKLTVSRGGGSCPNQPFFRNAMTPNINVCCLAYSLRSSAYLLEPPGSQSTVDSPVSVSFESDRVPLGRRSAKIIMNIAVILAMTLVALALPLSEAQVSTGFRRVDHRQGGCRRL
jgi:hypothetical protein